MCNTFVCQSVCVSVFLFIIMCLCNFLWVFVCVKFFICLSVKELLMCVYSIFWGCDVCVHL